MPFVLWTRNVKSILGLIRAITVTAVLVCAASASATSLTWDAGITNNGSTIDPADGTWDTTNLNWNTGSGNVIWTQTANNNGTTGAIFGGADGTYAVTIGTQVAATNMFVNNSGYTFSGSSGIWFTPNFGIDVAAGKTTTVNCPIASGNNPNIFKVTSASSVLNIGNNMNQVQPQFIGSGTINLTASSFTPNTLRVDCNNFNFTSGTWTPITGVIYMGFGSTTYDGLSSSTGTLTVDGGTINQQVDKIVVARGGGTGTLILKSGAVNSHTTGSFGATSLIAIPNNDTSANHASVYVYGGTLTLGSPSIACQIQMMSGGSSAAETAFLTQTGGVITTWGGILIGGSGTYSGGTIALTNSGGSLYIGQNGINFGTGHPGTNLISLSGGLVGALQNWSSTLPMNLDTLNGNITFQCADSSASPFNITLSGALTGPGGFFKTGTGTLQLSGANSYAGTTVVSNGILKSVTGASPSTNGTVIVDGTAGGSPTYSVNVLNTAQYLTNSGDLTYAAGTMTADFNYNAFAPSSVTAPLQVGGNVNFTATPSVTIEGSAIPTNTYPLIKYGGTVTGTMPTAPTSLPASTTAYITNITAIKTIALVVTASPVAGSLTWAVGSGIWDINTTANWKQFGSSVKYTQPNAVQFDDTAAGPFPITVANNSTVSPTAITVSTTNAYTLAGNGAIAGSGTLAMVSSGTLTMAGTNTYSGGTLISAGQININYGGDGSVNSAIGTGPLTLDLGAKLDNTSGQAVTLLTPIAQNWNDDWTFAGSTNFNTGPGAVTLGSANVILTVVSNNLEVAGPIGDNGLNYKITKQGNGSLTLNGSGGSTFNGGFGLSTGQVNVKDGSALGFGICTIDGGSIDNYSGSSLTIFPLSYSWLGSFSYVGASNNLDLSSGQVNVGPGFTNLNVVANTLITEGNIVAGNTIVHKTGQGTWDIAGSGGGESLGLSVDQGTVLLDKTTGVSVTLVTSGLLIQSNALAIITGSSGNQIRNSTGGTAVPVTVSTGGVFDLNGQNQMVDLFVNNNGILRNGAVGTTSALTITNTSTLTLTGTNCGFDAPDSAAVLNINATVTGSGSLVKTGLGTVSLLNSNSYTGSVTVNSGTLTLTYPDLATNATVTLATGTILNLNYTNGPATNIVNALVLGGTTQTNGIYNATTAPAYITGSGSLFVGSLVTINPLPGPIQFSVTGSTLALSWPTNLGWILQSQTNALNVGLVVNSNVWFDLPGSSSTTSTNIAINPANPTVFYRLRSP